MHDVRSGQSPRRHRVTKEPLFLGLSSLSLCLRGRKTGRITRMRMAGKLSREVPDDHQNGGNGSPNQVKERKKTFERRANESGLHNPTLVEPHVPHPVR